MGLYLNLQGMTKEEWLNRHAKRLDRKPTEHKDEEGNTVAVWVNNIAFTACALAYCQEELEVFTHHSDHREKQYFLVPPELLGAFQ